MGEITSLPLAELGLLACGWFIRRLVGRVDELEVKDVEGRLARTRLETAFSEHRKAVSRTLQRINGERS